MTCCEALCSSSLSSALRSEPGRVLEAIDHDPPDARAPQLEEDAGVGGGEIGVDQERERGEEQPKALDAVGPWLPSAQERIDDRHVHRLGADGLHGFGPAVRRDPLEAVGIEGPESENTFGWDGGQEQMSQNGPYLSQKGPKSGMLRVPD